MRARFRATGKQGAALLTTVILLLTLASIGAAVAGMASARSSLVNLEVERLQAAYLAEAGLARALYEIANGRDLFGKDGIGVISLTPYGSGAFQVEHDPATRSLVGVGVVGDVRRVIVYRYE